MTTAPEWFPPSPDANRTPGTRRRWSRGRLPIPRDVRPSREVAAVVVAALLFGVAALVVTEILLAVNERPPLVVARDRLADEAARLAWDDPAVLVAAGVSLVIGCALLALSLIPGRPHVVVLASPILNVTFTSSRRTVERVLAREATRVVGVARARVTLRRRTVVVRATGRSEVNDAARTQVEQAVRQELTRLAPIRPAAAAVRVRWKEARR